MKNILLIWILIVSASCVSKSIDPEPEKTQPANHQPEGSPIHADMSTPDETSEPRGKSLGLILGPGGMKAFAHIGVLHELQTNKVPIGALAGVEWGAVVGAFYAQQGRVHEAEWKLLKMPFEHFYSHGLFGKNKTQPSVESFTEFLKHSFANAQTQDTKVKFMCPAQPESSAKVMSRGKLKDIVKLCWPSEVNFETQTAALASLGAVIQKMEGEGITHILLVNVVSANDIKGGKVGEFDALKKYLSQLDEINASREIDVVDLKLEEYDFKDYDRGREIIRAGRVKSKDFIQKYVKKNNL